MNKNVLRCFFYFILVTFILLLFSSSTIKAQVSCASGYSCLNVLNEQACEIDQDGFFGSCSDSEQNGNCCAPQSMCVSGWSCLNMTSSECTTGNDQVYGACYTGHEAGTCCAQQRICQSPYSCYNYTRTECNDLGGYYGACYTGHEAGTCCAGEGIPNSTPTPTATPPPIEYTYDCYWAGTSCRTLHSCPSGCTESSPCSGLGSGACGDTQNDPRTCDCRLQLGQIDFSSLYDNIQSRGGLFSFTGSLTLGDIMSALLTIIFPIAGLILLLMLIYGGYNFMFSGGDPKKAQAAKDIITTALIGFIIIFIAYWMTNIIGRMLGVSDIRNLF